MIRRYSHPRRPLAFRPTLDRLESRDAPALFGLFTTANVGASPSGVVTGDFNGDGRPDLVVSNAGANTVTLLLGNGTGFLVGTTVATGSNPSVKATGDFNGDGRLDVAVVNNSSNTVSVLLGNGSGGLSNAIGTPFGGVSSPSAIGVADFNRDGKPDMLVANYAANTVQLFVGDGAGAFSISGAAVAVGANPTAIAVGDFNSDGKPDVAVVNPNSNSVTILLGNGTGGFSAAPGSPVTVGSNPTALAIGDFGNDGVQDLVVTSLVSSGTMTVLRGTGGGGFTPIAGSPFSVGTFPSSVAVADFNNDGWQDFAVSCFGSNTVNVLLNNRFGSFTPASDSPVAAGSVAYMLAVNDFNGDGLPDLAVAHNGNSTVGVYLNQGKTTTSLISSLTQAVYGQTITLTATVSSESGAAVAGTVNFGSQGASLGFATVTNGVATKTFTGITSLQAGEYSVTASFVANDAVGSFASSTSAPVAVRVVQAPTTTTVTGPPAKPAAGQPVALWAKVSGVSSLTTGTVTFYDGSVGLGTATLSNGFASLTAILSKPGTHAITAEYSGTANYLGSVSGITPIDVVGTAKKYAVGSGTGGEPRVKVYNTDGTQAFDFLAYTAGFTGGVRVATGDVNGDGVDDIITGAGAGGGPHVRVFDGTNLAELRSFFAYAPSFTGGVYVAAGDLNGDGKSDVVTGVGVGGGPHVRAFSGGNPSTVLYEFFPYSSSFFGGVTVGVGDVTGDNKADIVTAVGPGGGPHVRMFDGPTGAPLAGVLGSGFYAYETTFSGGVNIAIADLNNDGKGDVVTAPGPGRAPEVRIFNGLTAAQIGSFNAYNSSFSGGVRVATEDLDGDGKLEIITGSGSGGGPHLRALSGTNTSIELRSAFVFDPGFTGGVYVG